MKWSLAGSWLLAAWLLPLSAWPAPAVQRFALVVGSNQTQRADLPRLNYADDDAVRNYELLSALGAKVTLVASLDTESQKIYPWAASRARPAERSVLAQEVSRLLENVRAARAANRPVELYFWYSGHGAASGSEVALLLGDGTFTSKDLHELVAGSVADYNHVIIDACHASSLVGVRGEDPVDAALEEAAEKLDVPPLEHWKNYPKTGFVLARGGEDSKTYEWSEYKAGVVSHEIRSALSGAADVTGDHSVSYAELGAFMGAANARVVQRARPRVVIRPPAQNVFQALGNWPNGSGATRLLLRSRVSGHLFVEDKHGARLAEIYKDAGHRVELFLVPRSEYFVTFRGRELPSFGPAPGAVLDFERVRQSSSARLALARGPRLDQALRDGLFQVPFGRSFYEGFCEGPDKTPCEPLPAMTPDPEDRAPQAQSPNNTVAFVLLGGAAVAAGAGIGFYVASNDAYASYQKASPERQDEWRTRTRTYDWGATISFGLAGASAVAGSGLLVWNWLAPQSPVVAGPTSVMVRGRF